MQAQSARTRHPVVCIVLGWVLLTAAALKGNDLLRNPLASGYYTDPPLLRLLVPSVEFAVGLLLIVHPYVQATGALALATFIVLALINICWIVAGERSCHCFGNIVVNPWYTLLFDLAAITALLASGASLRECLALKSPHFRPTLFACAFILCMSITAWAGFVLMYQFMSSFRSHGASFQATNLDLGTLPPGGTIETPIRIRNLLDNRVTIQDVKTSCLCVAVHLPTRTLEPREEVAATVVIDLRDEPTFHGKMAMTLFGFTSDQEIVFSIRAHVTVGIQ